MIRYNEFLVLLRGKNLQNLNINDIIFGSIRRVRIWGHIHVYGGNFEYKFLAVVGYEIGGGANGNKIRLGFRFGRLGI